METRALKVHSHPSKKIEFSDFGLVHIMYWTDLNFKRICSTISTPILTYRAPEHNYVSCRK